MTRMPNPGRGPGGLDLNAMMKQVQQLQGEMMEAQEKLKDEVVEASAGGGMVKVKMSGDLRLLEIAIDPEAIDPEDAELLQDMVMAAVNEGIRSAQELATSKLGGIAGGGGLAAWAASGSPAPERSSAPPRSIPSTGVHPAPIQRLITELSRLPGIGQRTAQRLAFHILRADDHRGVRPGRGDPRGEGEGRAVRGLLQPRRGAALPDLRRPGARRAR